MFGVVREFSTPKIRQSAKPQPGCDLEQPRKAWSIGCSLAIYLNFSTLSRWCQGTLTFKTPHIFPVYLTSFISGFEYEVFIANIFELMYT